MLKWLTPDLVLDSVHDLVSARLKDWGVRGLIFDLDNTLLLYHSQEFTPEVLELLETLKSEGFSVCLVSNSNRDSRVKRLGKQAGTVAMGRAGKPRRGAFREAMKLLGTGKHETAAVGDQVFTDVLGANRLGIYSILVKPLGRSEFIGTKMVRRLEQLVLAALKRRGRLRYISTNPGEGEGGDPLER